MASSRMKLVGVDIFITQKDLPIIQDVVGSLKLSVISNRGSKVWPGPAPTIQLTDVHLCRFKSSSPVVREVVPADVIKLIALVEQKGFNWVHIEKLFEMDGKPVYSSNAGE